MSIRPETTRVAVVIVNYQAYDELRNCLSSLVCPPSLASNAPASFGAASPQSSIVVIDHASDARAADALTQAFPHVEVVRKSTNDGFAAGVNHGARVTQSRFLLLINPDCMLESSACCQLADWLDAHPDVAAVGPRITNADGTIQPSARHFPDFTTAVAGRSSWLTRVLPGNPLSRHNLPLRDVSLTTPVEVDWVSGACMLVRRDAFDAIGGMDEGFFLYWEDADFCRRLEHAGWKTAYLPSAGAMHVGGRSSRHAAVAAQEAFHDSAFRLYRKHAGTFGRLLSPLVYLALRMRLLVMKQVVKARR